MGDVQPLYMLRDFTAPQLAALRMEAFSKHSKLRKLYLDEYCEFEGTQAFLNAGENYPLLVGGQSNTYKCFITRSWTAANTKGVQGLLHPEGAYDDPKGEPLRSSLYSQLRSHFHFLNGRQLFARVDHHNASTVNVYGHADTPRFVHMANVFVPSTVDASFDHDGLDLFPA
ncbi:MAG: hypothetical protein ACJ746_08645 [Bryobacteraceae bacterium]